MLTVDSVTPREITTLCEAPYTIHPGRRARDVYGALTYLRTREDVDPRRVAAVGLTHGAWSLMYALTPSVSGDLSLGAVVALYPLCGPYSGFTAPLWILSGAIRQTESSYDCGETVPNVATRSEVVLRIYQEREHLIEPYAIDEARPWNLARPETQFDELLIREIEGFLGRHIQ